MQKILLYIFLLLNTAGHVTAQSVAGKKSFSFESFRIQLNNEIPSLGSFTVWQKGNYIFKGYFHGGSDSTLFNVKSITKSIISALGGIAKEQGMLPDLNTPVLNILTAYAPKPYPADVWFAEGRIADDSVRKRLTLENLLTMQTGFEWDDFGPLADAYVSSSDPVRFILDLSFTEDPGETFNYCSGAASVFGAVLSATVKQDLKDFANENLFNQIGVQLKKWDKDPVGRYQGASEIYLTNHDLIQFGLLYLNKGNAKGKQVIPASWIETSLSAHAELNKWPVLPHANGYGYFWWRRKTNGHQAYIASGAGGQIICIVPDLKMVIAATCFFNDKNRGRVEIKNLHRFIDIVTAKR